MSMHRRDFIDQTLRAAALTLAASGTTTLKAADAESSRTVGPNDKIRVATIGCNGQGGAHIRELINIPEVDLVAVCDVDPAAYEKQSKSYKKMSTPPRYVQDIRKLLEDKNIDAVTIATPNHWHALAAVWAMQAGKDVYVEKPCSHTVHEGRTMTQWARKLGRMCQMGVQSRSTTGMREVLDFIHSGRIGKVTTARAICYRGRNSIGLTGKEAPIPPGLDFDLWCGPAPKVVPKRAKLHYDWHWFWATGGGDITNQNPHELDKARWGLQKQELPKRVLSMGGRLGYIDDAEVANCQVTVYQWDDATIISDVRGLPIKTPIDFGLKGGPFKGAGDIWHGTDGYVVAIGYFGGVAYDNSGNQIGSWKGGEYRQHFENFLKAVRSRNHKDLNLDIEDGHLSSALAHLGNVSMRSGEAIPGPTRPSNLIDNPHVAQTLESFDDYLKENKVDYTETKFYLGKPLVIDPKTELSTDEKCNQLFTREYRKGFELPEVNG